MSIKKVTFDVPAVKTFCTAQLEFLSGLMGTLPEACQSEMKAMRDMLNGMIDGLPPIEGQQAATEAGSALECLSYALCRVQDFQLRLNGLISSIGAQLKTKTTEYNGLQESISGGAYIKKADFDTAVQAGVQAGVDKVKADFKSEIVAARRGALELCGAPVPSDEVLALPADQFAARKGIADKQIKAMATKGLVLKGRGTAIVERCAWLPEADFANQMEIVEVMSPATGTPAAAPKGPGLAGGAAGGVKKSTGVAGMAI